MTSPHDPATDLEDTLSEVALALFAARTVDATLQRIVDLAVAAVDGCDLAGILRVERGGKVTTPACSEPRVVELDQLQAATGEGPCLDARFEARGVYSMELADDPRWPRFGPAATAAGIRSALALRLPGKHPGALNLYAHLPAAFGATDRAKGLLIATLAGVALDSAQERADEEQRFANLQMALGTRELIGQAQGILMQRERITADQAFAVLRRASQHLNVKLREIAQTVVETGDVPPKPAPAPPRSPRRRPATAHDRQAPDSVGIDRPAE